MHIIRRLPIWLVLFLSIAPAVFSQSRINYNNQDLFLSGSNLAWDDFANDVGHGTLDTTSITNIMLSMHDNGGNAMRWWLHTDGTVTPEFNASDSTVIGPGTGTIGDIKKILDLAWEREIGIDLCLWSFNMLSNSNSSIVNARNTLLLNDTAYTNAYIRNCLIPMVEALKGHPAILTWEIFNEPEGMSNEFGWSDINHVPMSSIQRFVNLCAGAIHRTDTSAKVTSGAWSFYALTDNALAKTAISLSKISVAEKMKISDFIKNKYKTSLTPDEIMLRLEKIANTEALHQNYYRDDRLIAAGGDLDGTLDFYSVHYYSTSTPTSTSPFGYPAVSWSLTKPIVVAEFAMESGHGNPAGIATASLYDTLYQLGYAGALSWSFTDIQISSVAHMLAGMQSMWDKHQSDVDILGIGGAFPLVAITSPVTGALIADTTALTIIADASDSDGSVDSVEFFVADTIKIGTATTSPYTIIWQNIPPNIYTIKAIVTDNQGHKRTSNSVVITVGTPPMLRLEAESAARSGPGWAVVSDATASGGSYLNITSGDTTSKITWKVNNVPAAGNYPITFGYKVPFGAKKENININGVRVIDTLDFSGASTTTWYEKTVNVDLVKDTNTIQLQISWTWMYFDYLAVPRDIATSVEDIAGTIPAGYSLQQNFPNPFNPTTTINFNLSKASDVKLTVYNVLGQKVATLIDARMLKAGAQSIVFDASRFGSGVYFYRLNAGNFVQTKKMLLLK